MSAVMPPKEYMVRRTRSAVEQTLDEWLVLVGLSVSNPDKFGIQKAFFRAEHALIERGIGSPSFKFFRWSYGPFSKDLANDVKALEARGIVSSAGYTHRLADKGWKIVEHWQRHLAGASPAFDEAQAIVAREARYCSSLTFAQLREVVYAMTVEAFDAPGEPRTIAEIEPPCDLFIPYMMNLTIPALPPNMIADLHADLTMTDDDLRDRDEFSAQTTAEALRLLGTAATLQ